VIVRRWEQFTGREAKRVEAEKATKSTPAEKTGVEEVEA
jgi:hypothetical protein